MPQTYLPIKNNVLITGVGTSAVTLQSGLPIVIKPVAGRIARVSVLAAGTGVGSVNNCSTTAAVSATNSVFVIPMVVGVYLVDMPCSVGVTVVPGAGQSLAVSYS